MPNKWITDDSDEDSDEDLGFDDDSDEDYPLPPSYDDLPPLPDDDHPSFRGDVDLSARLRESEEQREALVQGILGLEDDIEAAHQDDLLDDDLYDALTDLILLARESE
jgi:hypothetical protein